MQHEGKQVTGLKQTPADFSLCFFQQLLGLKKERERARESSSTVQKL